jgi:hypothetical protein
MGKRKRQAWLRRCRSCSATVECTDIDVPAICEECQRVDAGDVGALDAGAQFVGRERGTRDDPRGGRR